MASSSGSCRFPAEADRRRRVHAAVKDAHLTDSEASPISCGRSGFFSRATRVRSAGRRALAHGILRHPEVGSGAQLAAGRPAACGRELGDGQSRGVRRDLVGLHAVRTCAARWSPSVPGSGDVERCGGADERRRARFCGVCRRVVVRGERARSEAVEVHRREGPGVRRPRGYARV